MSAIFTADTHFTDKPKDEYRWKLFDKLIEQSVDEVVFCGDLTDAKDRHSSCLVNRLVDNLTRLSDKSYVHILMGNHDCIDPMNPFFEFIDKSPRISYYKKMSHAILSIGDCVFIPSTFDWPANEEKINSIKANFVFTHITFNNSISENDSLLPGIDPDIFSSYEGHVISGDIHVPQNIRKNVLYIGAPYHIRFGDKFSPRVIHATTDGRLTDLCFLDFPKKWVLTCHDMTTLTNQDVRIGDLVKVRLVLPRREFPKWKEYQDRVKQVAKNGGWLLHSVEFLLADPIADHDEQNVDDKFKIKSHDELIKDYATQCNVGDDFVKIGKMLTAI